MRVVVHDNLKKGQVDAVRENSGNHNYFVNQGMLDIQMLLLSLCLLKK